MAVIMLDEGLQDRLRAIYNETPVWPNEIRLFASVASGLSKSTVFADFTDITGMSYAPITFSGGWAFATDFTNHWCIATQNFSWTFTPGGGLTVEGWYMLAAPAGTPLHAHMAEMFAAPVVIPAGGGTIARTINDKYQACS